MGVARLPLPSEPPTRVPSDESNFLEIWSPLWIHFRKTGLGGRPGRGWDGKEHPVCIRAEEVALELLTCVRFGLSPLLKQEVFTGPTNVPGVELGLRLDSDLWK